MMLKQNQKKTMLEIVIVSLSVKTKGNKECATNIPDYANLNRYKMQTDIEMFFLVPSTDLG